MLEFLILAAIVGIGFGSGYGVRDLISRRRRHRHRDWPGDWLPRSNSANPNPAIPKPANLKPDSRPAEPIGDVAINLDRLLVAANDDPADRQRPRQAGPPNTQQNRQDEYDVAVRDLLVELNRRSWREPKPPRRANVERLGQSRDRIVR